MPKSALKLSQKPARATQASQGGRVLVLGSLDTVDPIARELEADGFETHAGSSQIPGISDPRALESLRDELEDFAARPNPAGRPLFIHPGVSVWAERPELHTWAQELGLRVIGPPIAVTTLFADKLSLLEAAEKSGLPNLLLRPDPLHSVREIERAGLPFPFVLKSVRGGGSFGILVVHSAEERDKRLPLWLEQVQRNLGEVILFAERYLEGARHVTLPFARREDGTFRVFPTTDGSLQSRYRKLIEFCPAAEPSSAMLEGTRRFAEAIGYVGVGSLEFLVEGDRAYLVEGSARLNTSFRLWEKVAGTRAVAWQLDALGLVGQTPASRPDARWKEAVSLRLYAEDSLLQLPQPGRVREVELPAPSPDYEVDLRVKAGSEISPSGYGLLGMILAGGNDAVEAGTHAQAALAGVWIAGTLQTNERFLAELLGHPWVRERIFHAGFVDEEFLPGVRPPGDLLPAFVALAHRAAEGAGAPGEGGGSPTVRWAVGDQWLKAGFDPRGLAVDWARAPTAYPDGRGATAVLRLADGQVLRASAEALGGDAGTPPRFQGRWQVRIGHWAVTVRRVHLAPGERPPPRLYSLVRGRVYAKLFQEGSLAAAHEPLVLVDSLGILVPHSIPVEVKVLKWKVRAEQLVEAGQELAELEKAVYG